MTITQRALTNTMHDTKYYIEVKREESAYSEWAKEKKNQILRMTSEARKQVEWSKLFTQTQLDDSYLLGEVF